ncbi:MAG: hypothetical protein AAGG51_23040 [Cyanobacteria bacterium P01_G01_bin.54]
MDKLQYAGMAILSLGVVILLHFVFRWLCPWLEPVAKYAHLLLLCCAGVGYFYGGPNNARVAVGLLSLGGMLAWI